MNFGDLRFLMNEVFFPCVKYQPNDKHGDMWFNNPLPFTTIDENGHRHKCKGGAYATYLGPEPYPDEERGLDIIMNFYFENILSSDECKLPKKIESEVRAWIVRSGNSERLKDPTKIKKFQNRRRYMYSLVPRKRIGISEVEVEKMMRFVKKLSNFNYYNEFWFSIESGKHEDNPNLHVHIVLEFKNSGNFRDRIHKWFEKEFPENTLRYKLKRKDGSFNEGVDVKPILNDEIWKEKIDYLDNTKKNEFGDDHTNFIDLSEKYPDCKNWIGFD